MSSNAPSQPAHEGTRLAQMRGAVAEWPRWKKLSCVGAGAMVAVGLVLLALDSGQEAAPSPAPAGTGPDGVANLVDPGTAPPGAQAEAGTDWAPVFLRFGFSFFVGFAIATAMRSMLKLALLFCGLFALALFGLSEFGFVEVRWDAMGGSFDALLAKIGEESESVTTLLTGRLPSAGLGLLGLFAGFRKG